MFSGRFLLIGAQDRHSCSECIRERWRSRASSPSEHPSVASAEDVEYLIDEARRAFPSAPLDEIYYTYAGVRALVRIEHVRIREESLPWAFHRRA